MNKTLIIAEAGVNHNGSLELAKKLVDEAIAAGADIVKFQTFKADKIVSKNARKAEYQIANMTEADNNQYNMLKKLELTEEMHTALIEYCRQKNITFLSTPFDEESVDYLESLGIDTFKIPSGEITNLPYLKKIGSKGKKVIISTGMSNLEEIGDALDVLVSAGTKKDNIVVLHCNTEYPTPFEDVNLKAMQTIKDTYGVETGYSDHTEGIEIPIAAVALGATVIEKHFTLDKTMEGPDHKASLEPHELKAMVTAIRNVEIALGNGEKIPSASEKKNIGIVRKSLHLANAKKAGETIEYGDIKIIRPGDGISPMRIDEVVGKKAAKDLDFEHKLTDTDLV